MFCEWYHICSFQSDCHSELAVCWALCEQIWCLFSHDLYQDLGIMKVAVSVLWHEVIGCACWLHGFLCIIWIILSEWCWNYWFLMTSHVISQVWVLIFFHFSPFCCTSIFASAADSICTFHCFPKWTFRLAIHIVGNYFWLVNITFYPLKIPTSCITAPQIPQTRENLSHRPILSLCTWFYPNDFCTQPVVTLDLENILGGSAISQLEKKNHCCTPPPGLLTHYGFSIAQGVIHISIMEHLMQTYWMQSKHIVQDASLFPIS